MTHRNLGRFVGWLTITGWTADVVGWPTIAGWTAGVCDGGGGAGGNGEGDRRVVIRSGVSSATGGAAILWN